MPQCTPSIISGFPSTNLPLAPSSHSRLLALVGRVEEADGAKLTPWWWCVCLCAYMRFSKNGEVLVLVGWDMKTLKIWSVCVRALSGCVGLWGLQGCEVGSFSFPDELAGICKRWITRQRESIIQRRKKEKKRNMDPVPVAPGSLFQFRVIFLKCRREERRSSLEGVRAGWWGLENKENEWNCYMCVCVCVSHSTLLTYFHPFPLSPIKSKRQSAVWKCKRLLSGLQSTQMPLMMDECGI